MYNSLPITLNGIITPYNANLGYTDLRVYMLGFPPNTPRSSKKLIFYVSRGAILCYIRLNQPYKCKRILSQGLVILQTNFFLNFIINNLYIYCFLFPNMLLLVILILLIILIHNEIKIKGSDFY